MREQKSSPLGLYLLGISGLFLAGFLLLVILGAQSYRATVSGQEQNHQTRGLLSYLSAMVRANDREGAVYVPAQSGPEETAVLVLEDGSGYASRIYRYQGFLVEDYARTEDPFQPESALKIGKTDLFAVTIFAEPNLLVVDTDEGSVTIALRSRGLMVDERLAEYSVDAAETEEVSAWAEDNGGDGT